MESVSYTHLDVYKRQEPGYITEEGFCYSNQDIKKLVNERAVSKDNRGKGDVNRIYASKEAYLGTLYDVILGYIDPNRFITMEKSAIALKMTCLLYTSRGAVSCHSGDHHTVHGSRL